MYVYLLINTSLSRYCIIVVQIDLHSSVGLLHEAGHLVLEPDGCDSVVTINSFLTSTLSLLTTTSLDSARSFCGYYPG